MLQVRLSTGSEENIPKSGQQDKSLQIDHLLRSPSYHSVQEHNKSYHLRRTPSYDVVPETNFTNHLIRTPSYQTVPEHNITKNTKHANATPEKTNGEPVKVDIEEDQEYV